MEIHRILFPVDFSPACHAIVPYVKNMAADFHAEIIALHTVDMPVSMFALPDASGFDMLTQLEAMRKGREERCQSFLSQDFAGHKIKCLLADGDPATEIINHLRNEKADFIMMPTRGQGPMRKFLLGSVTAKVLHDADVPVWTGAHTAESGVPPAHRYRRILCAVDIESREVPVLQWADAFAKAEGAELHIMHAAVGAKGQGGEDDVPVRQELFKLAHSGLESLQRSARISYPATVRGGKPEIAIHDTVQDLSADLVIIGRGGVRGALGRLRSHAYSIVRQSPCPVISV